MLALGSLAVLQGALLAFVILRFGAADRARSADVIIVLGGGEAGTERRARHAAVLFGQGVAPYVVCTGSLPVPGSLAARNEAELCAAVVRAHGVPDAAILVEPRSRSTEENARESAAIMRARGWQSAVLVSDDFHLWRATWLFQARDVRVWPSPAQRTGGSLPRLEKSISVLREVAATGWYIGKSLVGLDHTDGRLW